MSNGDSWSVWSKFVIKELERLGREYHELREEYSKYQIDNAKKMDDIKEDISKKIEALKDKRVINEKEILLLKNKSLLRGIIGTALTVLIGLGVMIIKSEISK